MAVVAVSALAAGEPSRQVIERARHVLEIAGVQGGLIVHLGCGGPVVGEFTAALRANERYLVQGLDRDAQKIDAARRYIQSLGTYGPVSVAPWSGTTLPYVDNLVNLLVVSGPSTVERDEILRVLAPAGVAVPLLNSLKTYTMEAFLPLREKLPFKLIGLLVDQKSTGSEGSYYSVDELHALAPTIFDAAVGRHGFKPGDIFFDSTVFPLSIDMPMSAGQSGYTYRTFETIRALRRDPEFRGVHLSLGISNAARDLPGRRIGVCRAYLAKAREYGLDAAIVNVFHEYGRKPAAPDLLAFVSAFAAQDGSPAAGERVIGRMLRFCEANRKVRTP